MAANRIVLVTGMAGAGRTTALKALEDLGFEAVDNLPASLLGNLLRPGDLLGRNLAIGFDSRSRAFDPEALLAWLEEGSGVPDAAIRMLFLDCDDDVLARRFTETRRRHPMAPDRSLTDGIRRERVLIAPLRAKADVIIDTSHLSPGDLRRLTSGHFGAEGDDELVVSVVSFSYRKGLPREADLVFDVRFLANPHYDARLRPMTGVDLPVQNFIGSDPRFGKLLDDLENFLLPLLSAYQTEGKCYLTIAFGCTGGRHRSIATAERFAARVRAAGWPVRLQHRDTAVSPKTDVSPGTASSSEPRTAADGGAA